MEAILAASPVLLVLVLMVGFRASAAHAGAAGLLAAVGAAVVGFDYGGGADLGVVAAVGGAMLEGLFLALTILWILFAALSLHELQSGRGAVDALRGTIARLTSDRPIAALLVAWFFALFVEGAAGFGTPVALSAPLLVALGYEPVRAVTMALLGHASGVVFGAIGTPVLAQSVISGLSAQQIAGPTGLLQAVLAGALMVFLFRIARAGPGHEAVGAATGWVWAATAAACFLVPFAAIALWIGPELPTIGGAVVGGALFVVLLKFRGNAPATVGVGGSGTTRPPSILRPALPYLLVIGLVLASRLVPPVREALESVLWDWNLYGMFGGSFRPLHHPGTLLFIGLLVGGLGQGASIAELAGAMRRAGRRIAPAMLALVAMLALSRVMVHSGMIDLLASAAADATGAVWPVFSPAVGALGSFVTGSATASNVLFTSFQASAAETLDLPVTAMLAGQGLGAAVGNIICPHNVIAGAATVGLAGREGEILRQTAAACMVYVVLAGLLLYATVTWG